MSEHDQAIIDLGAKLAADPYEALPRAVVKMQWHLNQWNCSNYYVWSLATNEFVHPHEIALSSIGPALARDPGMIEYRESPWFISMPTLTQEIAKSGIAIG